MTTDFDILARDVADNLSMLDTARAWSVGERLHSSSVALVADDGHELILSGNGKGVRVSGRYPRRDHDNSSLLHHGPNGDEPPAIGVSISRGAQTIAKEIKRRLLPDYLNLWHQAQERYQAYLNDVAMVARVVPRLADAWGGEGLCHASAADRDPRRGRVRLPYDDGRPYGNLEVHSYQSGAVSLELSNLSFKQAEALGRAFRAIVEVG